MSDDARPPAVRWYAWYCYIAAALNFALFAVSLWYGLYAGRLGYEDYTTDAIRLTAWCFAPVGLAFGILNLILPRLPRTKSYYNAHFVNIALGLGSGCLTPFCLWLLVAWLRQDVRAYFHLPERGT